MFRCNSHSKISLFDKVQKGLGSLVMQVPGNTASYIPTIPNLMKRQSMQKGHQLTRTMFQSDIPDALIPKRLAGDGQGVWEEDISRQGTSLTLSVPLTLLPFYNDDVESRGPPASGPEGHPE